MGLMTNALDLCREYDMIPAGGTVLCAVSGGADSICLLHWLNGLRSVRPFTLVAAHYNHNLRGAESDRDEAFVREFVARRCGSLRINTPEGERLLPPVECVVGSGDVAGEAKRLGKGVEETARAMRYAFLEQTAQRVGAAVIATAHNADDNAETLLLHLIRGSALRGLTGIPPKRGKIVRPLLTTTRKEIEAYLKLYSVPHVEDSSNASDDYSRNRVRHRVLPEMEAVNPWLAERMSQTIRSLREDEEFLSGLAEERLDRLLKEGNKGLSVPAQTISALAEPVALRCIRLLLERAGVSGFGAAHMQAVLELCRGEDPSAEVHLPGGITARRVYEDLLVADEPVSLSFSPVCLKNGENKAGNWRVTLSGGETGLMARPRQQGDRLRLPKQREKTLKKLLIEKKIPRYLRESLPVVADEQGVLAVAGLGENTDHPLCGKVRVTFVPDKNEE